MMNFHFVNYPLDTQRSDADVLVHKTIMCNYCLLNILFKKKKKKKKKRGGGGGGCVYVPTNVESKPTPLQFRVAYLRSANTFE